MLSKWLGSLLYQPEQYVKEIANPTPKQTENTQLASLLSK